MPDAELTPENVLTAGITEAVRTFIADRAHGRNLATTPSTIAENLAEQITEYFIARVRPWSRSSRPQLAESFRTAIEAVEAAAPDDDLPRELLVRVLRNMSQRLDRQLASITDRPTTKENIRA